MKSVESQTVSAYTLKDQVSAAFLLMRAYSTSTRAVRCRPVTNDLKGLIPCLLGHDIYADDPEYDWTLNQASSVGGMLNVALISGCVQMPRTNPLPIGELPGLLGISTECLPPYK